MMNQTLDQFFTSVDHEVSILMWKPQKDAKSPTYIASGYHGEYQVVRHATDKRKWFPAFREYITESSHSFEMFEECVSLADAQKECQNHHAGRVETEMSYIKKFIDFRIK